MVETADTQPGSLTVEARKADLVAFVGSYTYEVHHGTVVFIQGYIEVVLEYQ